jgi:hypothetical protein
LRDPVEREVAGGCASEARHDPGCAIVGRAAERPQERAERERAQQRAAKRAEQKRMKRLLGSAYRNPARAPEHQPATPAQRGEDADPERSSQISTARGSLGDVPIFPTTRMGLLERLAYYEARKLNNLPNSLLDYHDVLHGRETPDERNARIARASGRSR